MIRRRRPRREVHFSFDSFLDVVANVVGIILRLILVAWAGARSYKAVVPPPPPLPALQESAALPAPRDPLAPELERLRRELADAEEELLARLRGREQARQQTEAAAGQLAALAERSRALEAERQALARGPAPPAAGLDELRERARALKAELEVLRRAPPVKQALRYATPVSRPLQTEEVVFECRRGRVTLVDTGALLDQVRRAARAKAEGLLTAWEVQGVTEPIGAFRLRYVLERERGPLDGPLTGAPVGGGFRCGLSSWEAEPVREERGEAAEAALAPGSAFREVVDRLDARQTAVTLWVYPDSFALYRRLRDFLHEREVVVAGRPLAEGMAIASSRRGTASRGQ